MYKNIVLYLLLFFSLQNYACTCVGKSKIKNAIKKSDAIFSGIILKSNPLKIKIEGFPEDVITEKIEYFVLVKNVYKGNLIKNDTIRIVTGLGNGDCGVNFLVEREYIIYANYESKYCNYCESIEKFLYTDICTRTNFFDRTEDKKLKKKIKS